MFMYVIALCIISFCDSASRVGSYSQLVLRLHWPRSSFFPLIRNESINCNISMEYLREHWRVFGSQRWVAQGLRPIDANGEELKECQTSNGLHPTYNHAQLHEDFVESLKLVWPVLAPNITEETLWETEFNTYGCCVSTNNVYYFEEAFRMTLRLDIAAILGRSGIFPGKRHRLQDIIASLNHVIRYEIYVKCLKDQNNGKQYLLEVQVCFDRSHRITHCFFPGIHDCDKDILITYPGETID